MSVRNECDTRASSQTPKWLRPCITPDPVLPDSRLEAAHGARGVLRRRSGILRSRLSAPLTPCLSQVEPPVLLVSPREVGCAGCTCSTVISIPPLSTHPPSSPLFPKSVTHSPDGIKQRTEGNKGLVGVWLVFGEQGYVTGSGRHFTCTKAEFEPSDSLEHLYFPQTKV